MALLRARLATAAVAIVTVVSSLILGCGTQRDQYPTAATVLVWVPGGVSDELASSVEELEEVTHTSEVLGGTLDLVSSTNAAGETIDQTTPGRTIPLDTLAYDPTTFSVFTDASTEETLSSLKPDEAILGATSARLRGSGVGGSLLLASGRSLTIRAVLDDHRVAGAEVVVSPATALELNVDTRRFVLARFGGWPGDAVARIRSGISSKEALRVVDANDTSWLRHGDQVAPQSIVKQRFGEFSARPVEGGRLSIDPMWVDANIVTETVPLLGAVTCHRLMIAPLRRALSELEAEGHGETLDRDGYSGCFYPRHIDGLPYLSRHSWGIALDLNIVDDERGRDVDFAPELVSAMKRSGFRNGVVCPEPDPAHFEWHPALTESTSD